MLSGEIALKNNHYYYVYVFVGGLVNEISDNIKAKYLFMLLQCLSILGCNFPLLQ